MGYEPSEGDERGELVSQQSSRIDPCFEPLAAVTRGSVIESLHRGAMAVVDSQGGILGGVGDLTTRVHLRSAAKPFQAAAVVESGAADAYSVSDEELAVICASHAGRPEHVQLVQGLLDRLGVPSSVLACGALEHMCSGKHAGMIVLARHLGAPVEGYERVRHPVQQEVARSIRSLLARRPGHPSRRWAGSAHCSAGPVFAGVDGCGVPVVRLSLHEAAWLYALLAAGATPALARVRNAMMAHPELVAGAALLDTRVMQAAPGRVVAKGGAEGVQGLALLRDFAADPRKQAAVGCIVKVEDGSARPIPSLIGLCLRAHGLEGAAVELERDYQPSTRSTDGYEVGRMTLLVRPDDLSRGAPAGGSDTPLICRKAATLSSCRGDEKEVIRFLRQEWPAADEEAFGRPVEWLAEPIAFVLRRDRHIIAVLKGHFIGGVGSVDELIVGRGQRGLGAGSLMLERFEQEADKRGCTRVILRAVKGGRVEDFYRSRGYYRECVQHSYEFGYDYVRLTRRLRSDEAERDGDAVPPEEGSG